MTLAFKVVDRAINGDHPSYIGRSTARVWPLPGPTDRERMQPQMPPLRSRPLVLRSEQGVYSTGLDHYAHILHPRKFLVVGSLAGGEAPRIKSLLFQVSRSAG
jgi:hypothetical protein